MKVNAKHPEIEKIRMASQVIRRGGTVAFPTETVYGLGADALNAKAVKAIFVAKKRPPDNPLIVHVASMGEVYRLASEVPKDAEKMMAKFWPGPLTLILKRSRAVPDITVAGLDTVAIRMPDNKVALALITESMTPIAAPSANIAGRPSPTTAKHVEEDLAGRIDIILDAGPTRIGVESTVIDMTVDPPQILRPGGIAYEKIHRIFGRVRLPPVVLARKEDRHLRARSPGMRHRHYAPNAEVIVVEGKPKAVAGKIRELIGIHAGRGKRVGVMATDESRSKFAADVVKSLGSRRDPATIAKNLFRSLRDMDEEKVDVIIAEGIRPRGIGLAVVNRLRKASGFNIVKA